MVKRFIAGAVCPRCGQQDKLRVDSEADTRDCVACGYTDERPVAAAAEAPKTRVSAPVRIMDTPAEPVTLVPAAPVDKPLKD